MAGALRLPLKRSENFILHPWKEPALLWTLRHRWSNTLPGRQMTGNLSSRKRLKDSGYRILVTSCLQRLIFRLRMCGLGSEPTTRLDIASACRLSFIKVSSALPGKRLTHLLLYYSLPFQPGYTASAESKT